MFLITLLDHASGPITYLLESLTEKLEVLTPDTLSLHAEIRDLMDSLEHELFQHHDQFCIYCKKHPTLVEDYWVVQRLFKCIDLAKKSLSY